MLTEETHKQNIRDTYFSKFDTELGKIDLIVSKNGTNLLYAEAKNHPTDIYKMFAQIFLTAKNEINKLGLHQTLPKYFGVFDTEIIAFVENFDAQIIFNLNDFNWNETPSNPSEKTIASVKNYLQNITIFYFKKDVELIKDFIKTNFNSAGETIFHYKQIDKNNFIQVYQHWLQAVKPHINVNWKMLKDEYSIYERDCFLAELNIDDNDTIDINDDKIKHKNFHTIFDNEQYIIKKKVSGGLFNSYNFSFKKDDLSPYQNFWKSYKRPPSEEYWNFIIDRQDLLVSQDVRERKGTFYTPQAWVELSQDYLAMVFGEDWQDNYYIWDCAAGSGNLLTGLRDKYRIFASDIDTQNINVMHERIANGANLLSDHVFQFDFLNDDFTKLPADLQEIINNENERKKLIIYINPPYAEAGSKLTKENKSGVATEHLIHKKYNKQLGKASNEIFAQFLMRIYQEIQCCKVANFAKLKAISASNFAVFRQNFLAEFKGGFLVPADTFDNVKGQFPIAFQIWDTAIKEKIKDCVFDVYELEK